MPSISNDVANDTPNFVWGEVVETDQGAFHSDRLLKNLDANVSLRTNAANQARLLERIRRAMGGQLRLTPSSWYRDPELNAIVGGVSNSAHLTASATDFFVGTGSRATHERVWEVLKTLRPYYSQAVQYTRPDGAIDRFHVALAIETRTLGEMAEIKVDTRGIKLRAVPKTIHAARRFDATAPLVPIRATVEALPTFTAPGLTTEALVSLGKAVESSADSLLGAFSSGLGLSPARTSDDDLGDAIALLALAGAAVAIAFAIIKRQKGTGNPWPRKKKQPVARDRTKAD